MLPCGTLINIEKRKLSNYNGAVSKNISAKAMNHRQKEF